MCTILVIARQREGKVFSHVCHSVHKGEGGTHCTWSQSCAPAPPPPDMFKLVQLSPYCTRTPPNIFKLVQYKARKVGKRAVGILLECFLLKSPDLRTNASFLIRNLKKLIKVLLTLISDCNIYVKNVFNKFLVYQQRIQSKFKWSEIECSLCLPIKFWYKYPLQNQDWKKIRI